MDYLKPTITLDDLVEVELCVEDFSCCVDSSFVGD